MTRVVPAPLIDDKLSSRFVEWMQGLDEGWVTDLLSRRPALKALGNCVVPQQATLALHVIHQRLCSYLRTYADRAPLITKEEA